MNQDPIEIQVMGGLGNQLHGLAAGIAIAGTQNRSLIVDTSRVMFGSNLSRLPELQHLQIGKCSIDVTFSIFSQNAVHKWHEKISRKSRGKIKSRINFTEPDFWDKLEKPQTQIKSITEQTKSIGGPFIDFDWADIAVRFGFPVECLPLNPSPGFKNELSKISANSIALHIRMGDYLQHSDIFPIVSERYYLSALKSVERERSQEVVIFTDSPKLLDTHFPSLLSTANTRVLGSRTTPLETLSLMSKYQIVIGSNSTFSGWASWFSGPKTIVTPVPHHRKNWNDRLPKDWIRLPIS